MVYESSYESGRKPFTPDTTRGYWATPTDFILICIGFAFKLDFFFTPMMYLMRAGIGAFIPYIVCLGLYVVPIMVIQSFMGQFSSSGYLAVFRISPLFKGMGYISLALSFAILIYYSALSTIPMLFLFSSFRPTLPWSCDIFEAKDSHWNASDLERVSICNFTDNELKNNSEISNNTRIIYQLPAVIFFHSHIGSLDYEYDDALDLSFSWELLVFEVLTWAVIAGVFYKFFNTAELGRILRYGIIATLSILVILCIRFMCLPGAIGSLQYYFVPDTESIFMGFGNVLVHSMYSFGPGWGTLISIASHNKFNTNIMRNSWIISICQMLIIFLFNFNAMLIEWHFSEILSGNYFMFIENHWDIYVSSAQVFDRMSLGNFWCFLYFLMLTMAAFIVIITQLYTLLVSLFDEFEFLRAYKMKVTFIVIGVLAFLSLYMCTNEGLIFLSALSSDTLFTQTALSLLLLLVVLWIYGRQRFQRDIEFMLGQPFATWKVNMLRFVAPLCLSIILLSAIVNAIFEHYFSSWLIDTIAVLFICLPWLSIPIYGVFILIETSGSWAVRIKRSCRPTDWYPVEQEDRQRYEEAMGNENITHQLNELGEEGL